MTSSANAQAQAPAPGALSPDELNRRRAQTKLPGEDMTIAETLRVMDVAREMRQQRESAEEMFRHDEVRVRLREKLMRTAAMSGDRVTEAEIDAAIDQYLANLHTYEAPQPGMKKFIAYCWIWRYRLAAVATAVAATGAWFFL
ncbi:DUF6384 family protein [Allorhodopirellula heiligendammensis]|uniref:Uncharacterized protein n=1 Tax=Allorhodopirellula heiligendammensis TaxID=2714739 RepID=A0A5C6C780_9BACT|nr:DUF6384 family protein [Allorhodopirellula heiligendammensis]TWU19955.1 hypothetical protein Poly21_21340 [Allorhodopirellula heiligendammensis]